MTEEQQKLKYVFIPPYDKPSKICYQESSMPEKLLNRPCEGCCTYESENGVWYPWGPEKYHCRLCAKDRMLFFSKTMIKIRGVHRKEVKIQVNL